MHLPHPQADLFGAPQLDHPTMPSPVNVTLTAEQGLYAASIGVQRNINAIMAGKRSNFGTKSQDLWRIHIEGAMGELVAAIALGLDQNLTLDTYTSESDLAHGIEVRTRSAHNWDLLVRPKDDDDAPYVLVTGMFPKYRVHGWLYGHECKKKKYEKEYGGREMAYFVPQSDLRPLADLPHNDTRRRSGT